ncbi:thioredoxin domain-containing protein [Rathayibacter sp. CAU 1779]
MPNRLADAVSPYLLSHADNPVDWHPWGEEAFAEARERDVPLFISIGYATCHWCHVMARETFSDPALAQRLNAQFVPVKIDREEHPDVDAAYLASAAAFTRDLGWPLSVFATPDGQAFFAGTYFPPEPRAGMPSFAQILDAVTDAWTHRRADVADTASRVASAVEALRADDASSADGSGAASVPSVRQLEAAATALAAAEDPEFGGFGNPPDYSGPKFPVVPVLGFLLGSGVPVGDWAARHTLERMAASALRDPIDGGFFRYGTRRDWGVPHYERMLYDNAGLLRLYADAAVDDTETDGATASAPGGGDAAASEGGAGDRPDFAAVADGIAGFLLGTMRASGGFASAQDSESDVDGVRREGAYYQLDADERAGQPLPGLDRKVLTGWNGLAIGALANAGALLGRADWIRAAAEVADSLLAEHTSDGGRMLVRASLDGRLSPASAALEDYGLFARGLLDVFLATGEPRFAVAARTLVDATMDASHGSQERAFSVPGGGDSVLSTHRIVADADPSEGAYPGGVSSLADAARMLYALTDDARYDAAARSAVAAVGRRAVASPIAFGGILRVATALGDDLRQLVVILPVDGADRSASGESGPEEPVPMESVPFAALRTATARRTQALGVDAVGVAVTEGAASVLAAEGFGLFESRAALNGAPTEYLCTAFRCELPRAFAI